MSDLIDRQAAIEIVDRYDKSHMILKGKPMLGAASIVIELEDLPSAQPEHPMVNIAKVTMAMANKADMVAVTRCKDCKHGAEYPEDKEWPWRCSGVWYDGDGGDQCVRPTSYCSFAERRTDE